MQSMRSWYPFLLGTSLLLVACPGPQEPHGGLPTPGPEESPSPDPSPSPTSMVVDGRLHDLTTGKPLADVTILNGEKAIAPGADGGFKVEIKGGQAPPPMTFLSDAHVPLTVYGYAGGPLFLRPKASPSLATASVTISLQAPAGTATESVLAIAVQPPGHAHASTEYLGTPTFSEQGTASVTATLPVGKATLIAYLTKSNTLGTLQAPVSSALSLTLSPVSDYPIYEAYVPKLPEHHETRQVATFTLVWPGEFPEAPNSLILGGVGGETTHRPIGLPPLSALGLPGASYAVTGSVLSKDTPRVTLAETTRYDVAPDYFSMPLLGEPNAQALADGFGLLPGKSTGATAYYADVLDPLSRAPLWRLVSYGQAPTRLTLPPLPSSFESWRLASGKSYLLQAGAADGLLGFKVRKAFVRGPAFTVSLPGDAQP